MKNIILMMNEILIIIQLIKIYYAFIMVLNSPNFFVD